ncbi:MAG: DUF4251 domain-containing protein [Bacteroidales bacterium]|jgi:uncharacterized protein YxeA|nr:DUF4251 domain-containing protein [Bacteroidales bacterium]
MKNITVFLLSILLFLGPANVFSQGKNKAADPIIKKTEKLSEKDMVAAQIANLMMNKKIFIKVTNVISNLRSSTVNSDGYYMNLNDYELSCYLPFFGTGGNTYGSVDNISINADKQKVKITNSSFNKKRNYYTIKFNFKNENQKENFKVYLKIFTKGKCSISLTSDTRSSMEYLGYINLYPENEKK